MDTFSGETNSMGKIFPLAEVIPAGGDFLVVSNVNGHTAFLKIITLAPSFYYSYKTGKNIKSKLTNIQLSNHFRSIP